MSLWDDVLRLIYILLLFICLAIWIAFGGFLVGLFDAPWVAERILVLKLPKSMAELGDSYGILGALFSSVALILALAAMLAQSRHHIDSNIIGGFSARQQFLLTECTRLEMDIKNLKASGEFKEDLFNNMVSKKSRYLEEACQIDKKLKALLNKF